VLSVLDSIGESGGNPGPSRSIRKLFVEPRFMKTLFPKSPAPTRSSFRHVAAAIGVGLLATTLGCQRSVPVQFVSSEPVEQLEPELQETVRAELHHFCGTPTSPKLLGGTAAEQEDLQLGRQVYEKRCLACHGVSGDGAGPAAEYLTPRPRDYRRGIFKFTSTPYGGKRGVRIC